MAPSMNNVRSSVDPAIPEKRSWPIWQLVLIASAFLLLYLPFLAIDYDSNGVIEAMNVESGAPLSRNHILYTVLGRGIFKASKAVGYQVRAIYLLQILNAVCGAIAVALAWAAFRRLGASSRTAYAAAGLWGTSFIFWYYSTDVAYLALSALLTAAALWCCASLFETRSVALASLLGLLIAMAVLTFQMLIFLMPFMFWPLKHRSREVAVGIVVSIALLSGCFIALGISQGHTGPVDLFYWASTYAGGNLPEWGRLDMSRVFLAADSAVTSFQGDLFERVRDFYRNPLRFYVWRFGLGDACFALLALASLPLLIWRCVEGKSKVLWLILGYVLFWPFITWFSPSEGFWFLVPNLFLCAALALVWEPWVNRPAGFALIFAGVAGTAAITFATWTYPRHVNPGIVGRKVACIASKLAPNDTIIATDWTWPATLEYFHGIRPVQVIDLAAGLHDRDKLFSKLADEVQKTFQRHGRVFIIDPASYSQQHLTWLAEQTTFSPSDFERFSGKPAFQCEDSKFREVSAFR
jgi:hypothetical protein